MIFRNLNIFASVLGFRRWSRRRDALAWAPQSIYRSTPAIHSQGIRVRDGRLARPDVPRRAHVSADRRRVICGISVGARTAVTAPRSLTREKGGLARSGMLRDHLTCPPDGMHSIHRDNNGVGISQLVASCHYGLTVRLEIHDVGPQSRTIAIHHHQQISIAVSA